MLCLFEYLGHTFTAEMDINDRIIVKGSGFTMELKDLRDLPKGERNVR